jgi:choline dehydrogenase
MKILNMGTRLTFRIGRSKALQPFLDLPEHTDDKSNLWWPGDASPDRIKDEEVEDWIRGHAETLYHPIGTARIGTDEKNSVVSAELKVHGVNRLRVVDASTFPSQISGHPVSAAYHIFRQL